MNKRSAKYVVQSEVMLLVTAMKRRMKANSDDRSDPLYNNLLTLKHNLGYIKELSDIRPLEYLSPFLDVISSGEMIGLITGLALTAVEKFISFRYIDISFVKDHYMLQEAIEAVANTVTNTKFVGTDHSSDEVILMKILKLLDTLMHAPAGHLISDYAVCKIISSCFRICFELQLSELLRHTAECTLERIVHLLFSRLPQLKEDTRRSKKNLTINLDLSSLNPRSRLRRKMPVSVGSHHNSTGSGGPDPSAQSDDNLTDDNEPDKSPSGDAAPGLPDEVTHDEQKEQGQQRVPSQDHVTIVLEEDEAPVLFDLARNESSCNIAAAVAATTTSPTPEEGLQPSSTELPTVSQYKTDKGIVFKSDLSENNTEAAAATTVASSTVSPTEQRSLPRRPGSQKRGGGGGNMDTSYGMACVHKLLSNLVMILAPDNICHTNHVRTGLTLVTAAIESGADFIAHTPNNPLLPLIQKELAKHLILLLQSERLSFFAASARVCFLLFESMRHHLKYQLEMYLTRMMRLALSDSDSTGVPADYREVALESLVQLWLMPGFITELYLNYDCDLFCQDLLQQMVDLFYKLVTAPPPPTHTSHAVAVQLSQQAIPMQLLALDSLLFMINSVHATRNLQAQDQSNSANPALQRKYHLKVGTEKLNSDMKEGLEYLRSCGFCETNSELAEFLHDNLDIDKRQIGEIIGKRSYRDVLEKYINLFDCHGLRIDLALRHYFEEFRLPGDAANIEIILEALSKSYHLSNPDIVSNDNAAYLSFYVIIMLNVSHHNSNAKKQQAPTSFEVFKKMMTGDNNITYIKEETIAQIYDSIKNEEIVMPIEQKGLIKENYLYKRLLRRAGSDHSDYQYEDLGQYSFQLFSLIWKSSVNAFVFAFEADMDAALISDKIKHGLHQSASIAAYYNLSEIMDKIIIYISKYTNFSNPQETVEMFGRNEKTQLAAITVFEMAQRHADIIRDGWKNLLDCLVSLFKAKLLPKTLIEVEDLISKDKIMLPIEEEKLLARTETQSVVNWLFSGLSLSSQDYGAGQRGQADELMRSEALAVVEHCSIPQLIEDTRFIKEASLNELINALINGTRSGEEAGVHIQTFHQRQSNQQHQQQGRCEEGDSMMADWQLTPPSMSPPAPLNPISTANASQMPLSPRDEQSRVFCLELLIRVLLHNSDRIGTFLPLIYDHFYTLLIGAVRSDLLLERTVVAALRLTIQLLRKEKNVDQVFTCLEILALTKMSVLRNVNLHIVCGLRELLCVYAANIPSEKDWKLLLTLLEICGAGTKLDPIDKAEFVSRLRHKEISSLKKSKTQSSLDSHGHQHRRSDLCNSVEDLCHGVKATATTTTTSGVEDCGISDCGSCEPTSRGYTSDSELYKASSTVSLDEVVTTSPINNNKWILLSPATSVDQPACGETNVTLYSEYPLPQVNQYNIVLSHVQFAFKDPLAIEKSCEILSHLIKDAAHISPTNFRACVHTLRVFAEVCVKSPLPQSYQNSPSHQRLRTAARGSTGGKSSRQPTHHHSGIDPPSASNAAARGHKAHEPFEVADTSYKVSAQLSLLMQTLHCRALKIYQEWDSRKPESVITTSATGAGEQTPPPNLDDLWHKCWCPLLQGMARLCCDVRPEVRTQAMNMLQNSLSAADMFLLSAAHWEDCFSKVLFPLSASFLESMKNSASGGQLSSGSSVTPGGGSNVSANAGGGSGSRSMMIEIADPRIRAIQILTKVFLQHLATLAELSTFTALWLTFLEYMDSYMKSNNSSDSLHDAVRETLKNVLLVMYNTGTQDRAILVRCEGDAGKLLKLTCDRLSTFLPDLVEELFQEPAPVVPDDVAVTEKAPVESAEQQELQPAAS